MTTRATPPHTSPMTPSNPLLADHAALDRVWERDGFWFFKNVLDKDAVARMRRTFIDELVKRGVVDAGQDDPVWNGKDLTDFPVKFEPLHDKRVWQDFVAEPAINAFFEDLLDGPVFWVPIVEYRITPPTQKFWPDQWIGRHQDGFSNEGIAFRTCWVPLMDIGAEEGGLAMTSGYHTRGYLHDADDAPQYPIPRDAIDDDAWLRSDYEPGDLVMFSTQIPHAGMPNYSNRFRMSLDIRIMPVAGDLPLVGTVHDIQPDSVVIDNHDGRRVTLRLNDDSYCRGVAGRRIPTAEMFKHLSPGDLAMASQKDGQAILLRPQR